jgi:8-hydroxy-5-deazaflavin:NADPH oxidoreductase
MKIGILGSGDVAKALGNGFLKYGNHVMLGTRDASKLDEWKSKGGADAGVGSFEQAAEFGEIIVLAVRGDIAGDVLAMAGTANLNGKTVIDATNPIDQNNPPANGVLRFFTDLNNSLMEQLQSRFPEANFVKAFSCVGNVFMVNPQFPGGTPSMFICGNNEDAKKQVNSILLQFGWEVEDMGGVEAARAIEPLCILWCIPGMRQNQWMHAFKLLKM